MKVLIIGAGISGLSMACALEKIGIKPILIEKQNSLSVTGAGIALPMNAVEILFSLGLKEKLMSIAYIVDSITYALPNGEILSKANLADNKLDRFPFVALHRKDLLTLLANSLSTKIQFSTTISNIHIDSYSKKVTNVVLNTGEQINVDLIIGADGINSQLRKYVSDIPLKNDIGVTTWRFIANFKQKNPIYYFGKISAFMIYPINQTEVYCYGHVLNKAKVNLSHKEHLARVFGEYPSIVNWMINSVRQENIISGRLESVSPLFKVENIAFIGDAAHACSPMLQQGAAKGLEDAVTLAKMLIHYKEIDGVLSHYEQIRKPRVDWINYNSDLPLRYISSSVTDVEYKKRNQLIRENGPINIEKWKILFSKNYIDILDEYVNETRSNKNNFISKL